MLNYLTEYGAEFLTGVIISIISGFIYTTTSTGFISGGKFRTKESAVFIYLLAASICGAITPMVYEFSKEFMGVFNAISLIGIVIIIANFAVHQEVKRWRHTSLKSMLLYSIGLFLIVLGFYI